jgi:uncharacterized protein (DUF1501 family)
LRPQHPRLTGQDLLEAGTGSDLAPAAQRDGWLNRALLRLPGSTSRTAFAVGNEDLLILEGTAEATRWSPGTSLSLSPQSRLILSHLYANDPLFAQPAMTALDLAEAGEGTSPRRASSAEGLAAYVAAQMNTETRIAAFSLGGWDTHQNQHNTLRPALAQLQTAILTLRRDLGQNWSRTAVLAMTEFGRTAPPAKIIVPPVPWSVPAVPFSRAVRGGQMLGQWPGLGDQSLYAGRDLMPERDIRAYAGWALSALFGLSRADIDGPVFPDLDLGSNPGFIA